jgi:hypothetical protein
MFISAFLRLNSAASTEAKLSRFWISSSARLDSSSVFKEIKELLISSICVSRSVFSNSARISPSLTSLPSVTSFVITDQRWNSGSILTEFLALRAPCSITVTFKSPRRTVKVESADLSTDFASVVPIARYFQPPAARAIKPRMSQIAFILSTSRVRR